METKVQSKRGFDSQIYMKIGDDQLVTLALKFVLESDKPPSFENIAAEVYSSFPLHFCLQGHPEWPHTLVIDRSIRRCCTDKNRKWVTGKAATGFRMMPAGETIANDTLEKLRGNKPLEKTLPKGGRQTSSGKVVKHIEDSLAFNKFQRDGNLNAVTEFDLCDLLYCTVESTAETLENNLGVLVSNVKNFQREDLVPFLNNLRHRFPKRFA
jgi:hypothetical protein